MNKIKNILFPIIFIALSSTLLVFIFGYTGLLSGFDLPEIKFPGLTDIFSSEVDNIPTKSNSEIVDELLFDLRNSGVHKKTLSSDMHALWLNLNEDLNIENTSDAESVKYAVYSEFDFYRNFVPDTLFIRPDTQGKFRNIKEEKDYFDILKYSLLCVEELNCDAVLVADENVLFDHSGKLNTNNLDAYLSDYNFDAVLISCDSMVSLPEIYDLVLAVSYFVRQNHPELPVGLEVISDFNAQFASEYIVRIFNEGLCDFGYVDCGVSTTNTSYPYASVAAWWNAFASHYNIPFYAEHRADKVFTEDGAWAESTEINEQIKALYDCPAFMGSCIYRVSHLKNKKLLARDLAIFLNDVAETQQDAMSVETLTIDSVNDTVTFTGKANEGHSVYCSEFPVENVNGNFNVTFPLDKAVNTFDFSSGGASYEYIIENNLELITTYYPTESITVDKNTVLHPYAVSPEGSRLFAVVAGNAYEMSIVTPPEGISLKNGYVFYSCDILLSKSDFENALLTLMCYKDGNYCIVDCGYLFSKNISAESSDNTAQIINNNFVSPYTDNGLGQAVLCKINYDNTEQIGKAKDYDTYKAYNSALLKGTIDYLDKIDVTPEGYLVYELKSGINVYGVDSVLINNGFNLPLNNINLVGFDDSQPYSTEFRFSYDWLSPITVSPAVQDYKVGYRNFSFNIDKFDAPYIDVKFYYSNPITMGLTPVFADNSVFSSYELFITEDNCCIMRLYLRNVGKFYGFDLVQNTDGTVSVIFKKRTDNLLAGKVIMLDPGHGGVSMVGTALKDNSVSESQVTLNLALYTKKYLEDMGATVIMTRTGDTSLPLSARTYMCETQNPDIFVSIHCDGSESTDESGTHTFYFTPFSQPLAAWIHYYLVDTYLNTIYTLSDKNFASVDKKIKYYPFYVTRVDNCPSVLVETGFMTNYVEGNVLVNPVNQNKLAEAIAFGIRAYFYNT